MITLYPSPLIKPMERETIATIIKAAFIVHQLCARPWAVLCANFYLIPTETILFPSILKRRMQRLEKVRNTRSCGSQDHIFYHQVLLPPPLGLGPSRSGRKISLDQGRFCCVDLQALQPEPRDTLGPGCVPVRSSEGPHEHPRR